MIEDGIKKTEEKMQNSIKAFRHDLTTIRTGHATPALVEHIKVDYAGVPTPLNQLASIAAPEARLLVIHPWERSSIGGIEKAIMKSDLGLNPSNDGNVIRISVPPLSEERRQELIKIVKKRVEERRVVVRNLRHETLDEFKKLEKNKDISQDEHHRAQQHLQKITDRMIADIDQIGQDKETDLLEV